jgi:hypothetical protein
MHTYSNTPISLFLSLWNAEFAFGYTATKVVLGNGGADIPRMTRNSPTDIPKSKEHKI